MNQDKCSYCNNCIKEYYPILCFPSIGPIET